MTDSTDRSQRSHQSQWAKALTVREAQRELGPLESVADVERWLKLIPLMQRTGRLRSKLVTTTMVNTMRRWCNRHGPRFDSEIIGSIEHRLAAIESKTSSGQRRAIGHSNATPHSSAGRPAAPMGELRIRQRRRLANRRLGQECRSRDDRRRDARRQRESSGRRGGSERRSTDRRIDMERRAGSDRRAA
jgi:hypothetical protein